MLSEMVMLNTIPYSGNGNYTTITWSSVSLVILIHMTVSICSPVSLSETKLGTNSTA